MTVKYDFYNTSNEKYGIYLKTVTLAGHCSFSNVLTITLLRHYFVNFSLLSYISWTASLVTCFLKMRKQRRRSYARLRR